MNFNISRTHEVYTQDKTKKSGLSKYAHQLLLESNYLFKYVKPLRRMLKHCANTMKEVPITELIGHWAKQMPTAEIEGDWFDSQIVELRFHMAALFINILQDSGEIILKTTVEHINPQDNGGKCAKRTTVVVFDGVKPVKYLGRGLESVPGAFNDPVVDGLKLSDEFKQFARRVSSIPFKRSDFMTTELLLHGYSLSKDYNSTNPEGRGECRAAKKLRIKAYATNLMELTGKGGKFETFYLPIKYDTRGRMYYKFNLIGMRPQGKLWETLMIDSAEPRVQGDSALKHLKHIIYSVRYGKVSVAEADAKFTQADLDWASAQDPMAITRDMKDAEKQFGEAILVKKAAVSFFMILFGEPCGHMFGKDLTNSGLMGVGASFGSEKIISATNFAGESEVNDAYTIIHRKMNLAGLTRNQFKAMIMPLLNGAGVKGMVDKTIEIMKHHRVSQASIDQINEEYITHLLVESLGVEILNISAMARWGAKAVNSYRTRLLFTGMDGFKVSSVAHMTHCPVIVTSCSASLKSRFRTTHIVADLPYRCQSNGMPMYAKDHKALGSQHPVQVKNFGVFANSAHAIDAVVARRVAKFCMDSGNPVLLKHDDYIVMPDQMDELIDVVQSFYQEVNKCNPHKKAMLEMHKNGCNMPPLPVLHHGGAQVKDSLNFLMP